MEWVSWAPYERMSNVPSDSWNPALFAFDLMWLCMRVLGSRAMYRDTRVRSKYSMLRPNPVFPKKDKN